MKICHLHYKYAPPAPGRELTSRLRQLDDRRNKIPTTALRGMSLTLLSALWRCRVSKLRATVDGLDRGGGRELKELQRSLSTLRAEQDKNRAARDRMAEVAEAAAQRAVAPLRAELERRGVPRPPEVTEGSVQARLDALRADVERRAELDRRAIKPPEVRQLWPPGLLAYLSAS